MQGLQSALALAVLTQDWLQWPGSLLQMGITCHRAVGTMGGTHLTTH